MPIIKASSPGKVLILGGYLIVESPNVGISIGTTARFETRILSWNDIKDEKCCVHILSPQFGKEFEFECTIKRNPELCLNIIQKKGPLSPFLQYGVLYSVTAALSQGANICKEIKLELLADNDFYSQRNYLEEQGKEVNANNLRNLPKYLPLIGEISKTGLGSSAAMTTSTVACLYSFLKSNGIINNINLNSKKEIEFMHRIAQVAHSVAQGKIGSGFDVYTATYGTCTYRRFPSSFLEKIMQGNESPNSVSISTFLDCISLEKLWVEYLPFRLPSGLKIVLGDVHQGGSGTPGMVSKVMKWRNSVIDNPDNLWNKLKENNERYVEALQALIIEAHDNTEEYNNSINTLKNVVLFQHKAKNNTERLWIEAASFAATIRQYLREMGKAANVEIEPDKLSILLDATRSIPGVFTVGCPGAGGYDAVFALVLGDETCAAVEKFWEGYTDMHICPLLVREDVSGLIISSELEA